MSEHDLTQKIPAGYLLIIETGEYSDRSWAGPVRVKKEFSRMEVAEQYKREWKSENDWEQRPTDHGFLPWLIAKGFVEDVDTVTSWHVGSYGDFEP